MLDFIKPNSGKKKVIAVGNPPYQESDGGFGKSARNIYPLFTQALIEASAIHELILVIPARWFGGGKGLEDFREKMKSTPHLENLLYFEKANEVFPSVDINGGICFLHFNKSYEGLTCFGDGQDEVQVDLNLLDVIPDDPLAFSILKKIRAKWSGPSVGDHAWASKPFGLRTNHFDLNKSLSDSHARALPVLSKGRKIFNVDRKSIKKNQKYIDQWKVSAPKAAGGSKGKRRSTVPRHQIFMVEPGMITTETYNILETFKSKKDADHFTKYLQTDFVRYLVGLRKISQDLPPDRWNWVPRLPTDRLWTNEILFQFFGLTEKEQDHLKKKVLSWS